MRKMWNYRILYMHAQQRKAFSKFSIKRKKPIKNTSVKNLVTICIYRKLIPFQLVPTQTYSQ